MVKESSSCDDESYDSENGSDIHDQLIDDSLYESYSGSDIVDDSEDIFWVFFNEIWSSILKFLLSFYFVVKKICKREIFDFQGGVLGFKWMAKNKIEWLEQNFFC